ncbi:MAG: tetratricopeptide repeat protein [Cytophagales bacterium]|nr:tetratricopeptide repeat protein [Cytophagales bacterium]
MIGRIEQLTQFIQEDPSDPFPRYALALEYLKTNPGQARIEFETLVKQHPNYLPTYYPAAHLMIEIGMEHEAEKLFLRGMDIARQQKNAKAEQELKAAYNVWQVERD